MNRSIPRGKVQAFPLAAAFLLCGFWHGIDLGYPALFITMFFNAYIGKMFSTTKLAAEITRTVPWSFLVVPLWIWNSFSIGYGGMAFVLLVYYKFNPMRAALGYSVDII